MTNESILSEAAGHKRGHLGTPLSPGALREKEERECLEWFERMLAKAQREGIFTIRVFLVPALAAVLMSNNPGNRSLKPSKIAIYKQDMAAGKWELNGETIKISLEGAMNDGQHRCQALLASEIDGIDTLITFGLPRYTRLTVDQGANRSAGDYLGMEGVPNGNHIAAIASLVWQMNKFGSVTRSPERHPTRIQVRDTYHANPQIMQSLHAVPRRGSNLVGGLSVLGFCHFMIWRDKDNAASKARADYFIEQLVNGELLEQGDPIYAARARLIGNRRLKVEEKVEIIFRGWNGDREGRKMRTVPVHRHIPVILE